MSRLKHTPMLSTLRRRINESRPPILRRKPMQQRRIRPELLRPAMKLPRIAQQNLSPPGKRPNHAANLNILLPVLTQIANRLPVGIRAHHGKATHIIRRLRTAHIQKSSPIRQLHHVIHMRSNTNILVLVRERLLGRIAGPASPKRHRTQNTQTQRKHSFEHCRISQGMGSVEQRKDYER